MNIVAPIPRRAFLHRAAAVCAAAGVRRPAFGAGAWPPPVVVFSKVYQEIKLDFESAAALTAAAGLAGIDCPVRPGGEIEPGRAADDMPRYAEALRRRGVAMRLLTTGIVGTDSPHAETILRTARQLGIRYYRLGAWGMPKQGSPDIAGIRARLKDLAAMNREIGVTGVVQNHSGNFVGGNLAQMAEILEGFDPDEVGMAFDLCHALIAHRDEWTVHFERLSPRVRVAYVKDVRLPDAMAALGEGEMGQTDWFSRLKRLGLAAPISLHIEYEWAPKEEKTTARLEAVMRRDLEVLRRWLDAA